MARSFRDLRDGQRRRDEVKGTVLGTAPGNDNWPRQEIDVFITQKEICNLFLLAVKDLQEKDQGDPWSWFGISSIHGIPYEAWQKVDLNYARVNSSQIPPDSSNDVFYQYNIVGDKETGYCAHSSVTFPSWHRPYLAMMEQAIYLKCAEIADTFPEEVERARYQEAATKFRLPYFDPFRARVLLDSGKGPVKYHCGIPQILSSRVVRVDMPNIHGGVYRGHEIHNPLYSYKFQRKFEDRVDMPFYKFDDQPPCKWMLLWAHSKEGKEAENVILKAAKGKTTPNECTVRKPSQKDGNSRHDKLRRVWNDKSGWRGITTGTMFQAGSRFYDLLSRVDTYGEFSNTLAGENNPRDSKLKNQDIKPGFEGTMSLEGFHNAIHAWLGGNNTERIKGHMMNPIYSSFDPIFWLHHCNIDRVFAIWQKLNPEQTTFSQNLTKASFTDPAGYRQTQDTPLLPFMRENVAAREFPVHFWTSAECRDTNVMGYYYEETRRDAAGLTNYVNENYLWLKAGVRDTTRRPPSQARSGFPVNFGPNNEGAYCLPVKNVLVDGKGTFPSPYLREQATVRAVRSIDPAVSGVPTSERRTVDAPGADSEEIVPSTSFAAVVNTNSIRQWEVRARFEKFGAGGAFYIYFFIGKVHPDMSQWEYQTNYAGYIFNFASSIEAPCANCAAQASANVVVGDNLDLTSKLIEFLASPTLLHPLSVKSLSKEDVIPFLRKHLEWRIVDESQKIWRPSDLAGFKILVGSSVFHPPATSTVFGTYTDFEPDTEITHDKDGGVNHNEVVS